MGDGIDGAPFVREKASDHPDVTSDAGLHQGRFPVPVGERSGPRQEQPDHLPVYTHTGPMQGGTIRYPAPWVDGCPRAAPWSSR